MSALELHAFRDGDTDGVEARREGVRVGWLAGQRHEDGLPSRGRHVWVALAAHGLAAGEPPGRYRYLYAAAGDPWVRDGFLAHFVVVPADEAVLAVWHALGFGYEQVHAAAPTHAEPPPQLPGVTVRRGGAGDLDTAVALANVIHDHLLLPPVWSGLPPRDREEVRDDWRLALEVEPTVFFLAERDGSVVADALLYLDGDEPSLSVVAVLPEARGLGLGRQLAAHALHAAHALGHERCLIDWRSANTAADRSFRAAGFVPTAYRLRRDVQPYRT